MISLAACVSVSTQFPTAQPTTLPTATTGVPNRGTDLTNTDWTLVSFTEAGTETPVLPGSDLSLSFHENGEVDGSGGCNSFGGQYQVQGNNISFQQLIHTEMACTTQDVNEQEQTYLAALQSSVRFEQSGDTLKIWYGNGQDVLTFSRGTASLPALPVPTSTEVAPTVVNSTATTASLGNVNPVKRIAFATGATTATVTGHLEASQTDQYVLHALAGQTMTINLTFTSGKALLIVWGADGDVLLSDHAEATSFQQVLQTTQDYSIHVRNRPDGPTDYSMTISIPTPASGEKRIEFTPGATVATVSGQLNASASDQYVLNASAGQTMSINLTFSEGAAILVVWGEDGNVLLSDHAEASSFQMVLPTTQDYHIMVHGRPEGPTAYTMTVSIPPAP
jgi:heat shock protein HslJ